SRPGRCGGARGPDRSRFPRALPRRRVPGRDDRLRPGLSLSSRPRPCVGAAAAGDAAHPRAGGQRRDRRGPGRDLSGRRPGRLAPARAHARRAVRPAARPALAAAPRRPRAFRGGRAMNVQVLAPGLQATVQDAGRHGWRHLGVGRCGALDPYSHAVANLLVGNAADAPVLEFALAGPRRRFERAARIAIAGASCDARVGDLAIPGWRPVDLPAGSVLQPGRCVEGARAYLAVAGGWSVPGILGSASTDLRGGFGGLQGRALVAGDALPTGAGPAI